MDDRSRNALIADQRFSVMKDLLTDFTTLKKTVVLVIISNNQNDTNVIPNVTFLGKMLIRSLNKSLKRSGVDLKIIGVAEKQS